MTSDLKQKRGFQSLLIPRGKCQRERAGKRFSLKCISLESVLCDGQMRGQLTLSHSRIETREVLGCINLRRESVTAAVEGEEGGEVRETREHGRPARSGPRGVFCRLRASTHYECVKPATFIEWNAASRGPSALCWIRMTKRTYPRRTRELNLRKAKRGRRRALAIDTTSLFQRTLGYSWGRLCAPISKLAPVRAAYPFVPVFLFPRREPVESPGDFDGTELERSCYHFVQNNTRSDPPDCGWPHNHQYFSTIINGKSATPTG